jgi:hypothetical protein
MRVLTSPHFSSPNLSSPNLSSPNLSSPNPSSPNPAATRLASTQKEPRRLSSRQISAAAENIAAAQFGLYGFDVLEQGVRGRFLYDLGVANADGMLKVTVQGSFRGFWNLVDPYVYKSGQSRTKADYHRAIDRWVERQGARVTFCLVQFEFTELCRLPRIYLATAAEIAARLHESVETLGDTALYEEYELEDGNGHRVETLPARWRFSRERIAELMDAPEVKALEFRFAEASVCSECLAGASACARCLGMIN